MRGDQAGKTFLPKSWKHFGLFLLEKETDVGAELDLTGHEQSNYTYTVYLPKKQAPSYMHKSEANLCWVNKIITSSTCNGLGFWSTGIMRITISDSMLKYPNTSHCGTDTCRRIFSSMSSTVIGFLFVTWKKTKNSADDVTLWKILLLSFNNIMSCQKMCGSHWTIHF